MKCVSCIFDKTKRIDDKYFPVKDAVTVYKGTALCETHAREAAVEEEKKETAAKGKLMRYCSQGHILTTKRRRCLCGSDWRGILRYGVSIFDFSFYDLRDAAAEICGRV